MARIGYVYKLVCSDIEITEIYVGSTTNMKTRKSQHKHNCNTEKSKAYNTPIYQFIREHGGWDNWLMVAEAQYNFDTRDELNAIERGCVESLHATLNQRVPNRDKQEYYQDNAEAIKIKQNQKHDCACGGRYTQQKLSRHTKSTKHMVYEALHQDEPEDPEVE